MNEAKSIAIIGAGASGMIAAIRAAENDANVTLFEKNNRVGKKILATGNGKCNLGNLNFGVNHYYCQDPRKLERIFQQFSVQDTIDFFERKGLMIRDKNGYLYPYSEQATAVLDILRAHLLKIKVITDSEICSITYNPKGGTFELIAVSGKQFAFSEVILACGSPASLKKGEGLSGYQLASKLGHKITERVPGLVSLGSDERFIKALAGVRCQAGIQLFIDNLMMGYEIGELQFTDYGLSGIPVFQISRMASYAFVQKQKNMKKVWVRIDLFPDISEVDFGNYIRKRYNNLKHVNMEEFLAGTIHKKINSVMLKEAALKADMSVEEIGLDTILKFMKKYKKFDVTVNRTNTFDKAQICAGGVDFTEITEQMESKLIPGLFFVGEMVDVDGKCGGYNLQWAWTSGYLAGLYASGGMKQYAEN